MCIICNTATFPGPACAFISAVDKARRAMKEAERHMLAVAADCPDPDDARRYRSIHKRMVHHRKAWNRLEQEREA